MTELTQDQMDKIVMVTKMEHIECIVDKIFNMLQDQERGQESIKATKNTKKVAKIPYSYEIKHATVATQMYEIIKATTKTRKPNLNQWANDIRKINEIDKIPIDNIMKVFKAANKDDCWSMNVRSPKKLRKHWDRLYMMSLQTSGLNQKTDNRESLDYFKEKKW